MSGAVVVMHQNRLMCRFRDAKATDPKSAKTLEEIGCRNSWTFRRMAARGVFVETHDGRFYMDIVAHVRRKNDGKEFYLGLAELGVTDKNSPNFQLVDDYAVWLVNNR